MKLFVIGASGLVGGYILRQSLAAGHQAIGTYRNHPVPGLIQYDCADPTTFESHLDREKPDAVIHAAGWTWVDGCEADPSRAFAENSEQPAQLAKRCHARGIHFTYISSSYVFDGKNGPYRESDSPNPINVYGRSKLRGEESVSHVTNGTALIARVICVYGAERQKKNFAYQMLRAVMDGKEVILPSDQKGNPTYARDIANWLLPLITERRKGIYHLPGPWPDCTRVEWAEKLVQAFQAAQIPVNPNFSIKAVPTYILKQPALRPLHAGLLTQLNLKPTEFRESIREMLMKSDQSVLG